MNILPSNDDGFKALGLCMLDQMLSQSGHRISVAAPETEQSGKSHGFTITGRIRAVEYDPGRFFFSGTPADCIIYSHRCSLFPASPDVVISGINHGYNLSCDIIYSGTCAAARQAAMYGMKAIAVSAENGEEGLLCRAAAFVRDNLPAFIPLIPQHSFMNINVPASFDGGWAPAGIGFTAYLDNIVVEKEDGKEKILRMDGCNTIREGSESRYPADSEICGKGLASVSIIRCLPAVDEKGMESLC